MALECCATLLFSKIIPLALSALGFGLLVVVHELGHFLFCKLFGIHTPTFSIGFGSALIEKKIGKTNFRISKLPLGGYVEIAGLAEAGQGEQLFAGDRTETSFAQKPYWQRFLVLMGGILFNLTFAYLTFITLFTIGDRHTPDNVTICNVAKDSPADQAGLKPGDQILALDGQPFSLPEISLDNKLQQVLAAIQKHPNQDVELLIERDKQQQGVIVHLGSKKISDDLTIGVLGAHFPQVIQRLPLSQAVAAGIKKTNDWIVAIALSLKSLFSSRSLDGAGGPVMILAEGFRTAQQGLFSFFIFLAIMSINLALFNLLPLGITDGGSLLLTTIEAIIRRPLPESFRIGLNVVSLGLFLVLAVYLTYKDIVTLFGSALNKLWLLVAGLIRR